MPTRSDLGTKQAEEYSNQALSSFDKDKGLLSKELSIMHMGSENVAQSNRISIVDEYAHFREETELQSSK